MTDAGAEAAKAVKARKRAPTAPSGRARTGRSGGSTTCWRLDAGKRARLLAELTPLECVQTFYDWMFWARPDQEPPPGDWIVWLILAGRGAGKTRAGAEAVRRWTKTFPIVNLIGPTADDVRDVMVLGESGILNCCRQGRAAALSRLGRPARLAERRR